MRQYKDSDKTSYRKSTDNTGVILLPTYIPSLQAFLPVLTDLVSQNTFRSLVLSSGELQATDYNRLLGLAFHAVADLLATYETSRDSWHAAAIAGHSSLSKLFPLSVGEMTILKDKNIYTVSQLLEVNDLTGRLTIDENRLLLADLSTYPHLQ
jgi:hypothetical protein